MFQTKTARLVVLLALLAVLPFRATRAQDGAAAPFDVDLVETTFAAAPALHSGSVARWEGRWLFVGGRTNGLHGFRENPFPPAYANGDVWVVDPAARQVWSASLSALPDSVADPLRAANPQHYQVDDTLYVVGGFGDDHVRPSQHTFPTLTAIDVPGLVQAVVDGTPLATHLEQLTDERLRVTGGILERLGDRFYLVFGHDFSGYYSRDTTTFDQRYTEEVRTFRVARDEAGLRLADYEVLADAEHFHRRDLNVAPVVHPDGSEGLAAYGGVFQRDVDLPFERPIYFDESGYTVDAFAQRMSAYTCPVLPLFDAATGNLHTVFFGGMGRYYVDDATGEVAQDDQVPFIDEVTTLTRYADGTSVETVLPVRMPALLGTNAYLLPADGAPRRANGVVRFDELGGRTLVAYVYGGIQANLPNNGASHASNRLFEVYVTPRTASAVEKDARPAFEVEGPVPDPFLDEARLVVTPARTGPLTLDLFDVMGRRVARISAGVVPAGRAHTFTLAGSSLPAGVYFYRITGEATRTGTVVHVR